MANICVQCGKDVEDNDGHQSHFTGYLLTNGKRTAMVVDGCVYDLQGKPMQTIDEVPTERPQWASPFTTC